LLHRLRADAEQIASAIVEVEVVRAVRRGAPDLVAKAVDVVEQLATIEIDVTIRDLAARLDPALIRSLDAIHLATALRIGQALDAIVTYDVRMAEAAESLGLRTIAPR